VNRGDFHNLTAAIVKCFAGLVAEFRALLAGTPSL
jgi:hypothetical protein